MLGSSGSYFLIRTQVRKYLVIDKVMDAWFTVARAEWEC
jgi:hypothetical protein